MKLFLDDVRPAPPGWTLVRSAREAIEILEREEVEELSLDYDLWHVTYGDGDLLRVEWSANQPKGMTVVTYLIRSGRWPKKKPLVHSANEEGAAEMRAAIEKYGPY